MRCGTVSPRLRRLQLNAKGVGWGCTRPALEINNRHRHYVQVEGPTPLDPLRPREDPLSHVHELRRGGNESARAPLRISEGSMTRRLSVGATFSCGCHKSQGRTAAECLEPKIREGGGGT